MKKITLMTLLFALFSVVAFAQKDVNLTRWQGKVTGPSYSMKGVERNAQSTTTAARRASGETVTPPSTATVQTWYTIGGQFFVYGRFGFEDQTAQVPTVNVAIDGSDLYIAGLAHFAPNGWIKGTISGNTVVFPCSTLAGADGDYEFHVIGSNDGEKVADNIVFNYDAEQGLLEAATTLIIESPTSAAPGDAITAYAYWAMPKFSKDEPKGPEPVVAPEGLVTSEWAVSAVDNYGAPVSTYFYIGFDGNDVYLKGFTHYLPEAWLKGTLSEDGKSITFEGGQYFGPCDADLYTHYEFYLKDGFTLAYDADAGKMTGQGELYVFEAIRSYKGDVYNNPVITKVVEQAGKPATPNISQIYDGTLAPIVMFTIPTTDVNGNAMLSSKVSFQFLKDIEQEISPVVFDPADYPTLTEPMSVFPYGFTDDSYLFYNNMHLYQKDFGRWNKIGLQIIYTGGDEENKSDIFWLDIKPYEKAFFNFNAMEVACSSSESHDGDITEPLLLTENKVKLTVSPKTSGSYENRFWSTQNGPQLRMYSGTMTFQAPVGKVITKIVFNDGKWNEGNSADTGAFNNKVWQGEANKVVVTIAGNTQLNSIEVYPTDMTPVAVDVPEGLVTNTYILKANVQKPYYDPAEATLWLNGGFDGDDFYIQGLAQDANDSAKDLWVKATKNEAGQYVIPANQFMGEVSFWMSTASYFFTAVDAEGNMVDAVFNYDAEKGEFTTTQALAINSALTELNTQETFTNVAITKFDEVAATPATPTVKALIFDEWSHNIQFYVPTVGTNGETLNPGKHFYTIWVEVNGEQKPYVFTADMYYTDQDVTEQPYSMYYSSWDNAHNIYFADDAAVFATWAKVGVQSIYYGGGECKKSEIAWGTLTGISDIKADMQNGNAAIYNLAGLRIANGQKPTAKGLYIVNGKKVVVK